MKKTFDHQAQRIALLLIKQLPAGHEGRDSFLLNYGECVEAEKLRVGHVLKQTGTSPEEKVEQICSIFNMNSCVTDTPYPQYGNQPPMPPQAPQMPRKPNNGERW